MKPVYFPYTFMTERVLRGLGRFFETVVVLQPTGKKVPPTMERRRAEGGVEIRSAAFQDDRIEALLKDYRTWVQQHRGRDISIHKFFKAGAPFFGKTSVSRIKQEIRGSADPGAGEGARKGEDHLLRARLFLQMAQEFDEQNLEISRSLEAQAVVEEALFAGLKGEGTAPRPTGSSGPPPVEEPFGYMAEDRLREWARLMLSFETRERLFVTHRREAIEAAAAAAAMDESDMLLQRISAAALQGSGEGRKALSDHLRRLSRAPLGKPGNEAPVFGAGNEHPLLELYVIPGLSPEALFARLAGSGPAGAAAPGTDAGNTLLGLVEPAV